MPAKKKDVNVALIGQAFMGRTHSNGWSQVNKFFDAPRKAVLHTICARKRRYFWAILRKTGVGQIIPPTGKKVIADPEIDLVDIGTPNHMHCPMAIAALQAGKAVACEKTARKRPGRRPQNARRRQKKQRPKLSSGTIIVVAQPLHWPICSLKRGKIGKIRHVRAKYLQEWAGPDVPLTWEIRQENGRLRCPWRSQRPI